MAAYSMDLRTRVLRDSDAGMASKDVAAKYAVSRAWVDRVKQRRRETGEVTPRRQTAFRRRTLNAHHEQRLVFLITARPDATLAELLDALPTNGGALTSRPRGAAGGTRSRFMTCAAMGSSASRASRPICCAGMAAVRGASGSATTRPVDAGRRTRLSRPYASRACRLRRSSTDPLDNPTFMAWVEQNQA